MAHIILRNAIIYWQMHSAAAEQRPVPLTRLMKYQTMKIISCSILILRQNLCTSVSTAL